MDCKLRTVKPISFSKSMSVVCNLNYGRAQQIFFCHDAFIAVKLHSKKGRVIGKTTQNTPQRRDTSPLTKSLSILVYKGCSLSETVSRMQKPWRRAFIYLKHVRKFCREIECCK